MFSTREWKSSSKGLLSLCWGSWCCSEPWFLCLDYRWQYCLSVVGIEYHPPHWWPIKLIKFANFKVFNVELQLNKNSVFLSDFTLQHSDSCKNNNAHISTGFRWFRQSQMRIHLSTDQGQSIKNSRKQLSALWAGDLLQFKRHPKKYHKLSTGVFHQPISENMRQFLWLYKQKKWK